MANTLTGLLPALYESLDTVSRELVGFIPSVAMDASAERAAVGQAIYSPITPAATPVDNVPGVTPPNDGSQVIGNNSITIVKSRSVPFQWTGEEQQGIQTGPGYNGIKNDQITQAMRALTNEIELYLGGVVQAGASRATGTAGNTPFASDLSDPANVLKILKDNGAPNSDLNMVINTAAGAKMRTLTQLTKANEAADTSLLRQGELMNIHGFSIRESAGVVTTTKGTGTGYVTNGSAVIGQTAIPVITGSGTVLAGDVVTFAGDPNKYLVASGVSAPGTITLAKPGLLTNLAGSTAMTIGSSYTANAGFHRNAIVLATRAPAMPREGDMADDAVTITDPRSGLSFDVRMYRLFQSVQYRIGICYGAAVMKPEHVALLLG